MKSSEFGSRGQIDRGSEYSVPTSFDAGDNASGPIEPQAASRPGPPADGRPRSRFSPQKGLTAHNTTRETGIGTADSGHERGETRDSQEAAPSTGVSSSTAPTAAAVLGLGDLWQSAKIAERATRKAIKEAESSIGRELSKTEKAKIEAEQDALADKQVLAKKQQRLRTKIERRGGPDVITFTDIFDARSSKYVKQAEEQLGRELTEDEKRSVTRQAILDKKRERIQKEQKILAAR